jgi:putative PEP-CTERM system histidine kinase
MALHLKFDIAFFSHAVATFTFGLLTIYLAASLKRRGPGLWLVLASGGTAAWGLLHIVDDLFITLAPYFMLVRTLLNAIWLAFLMSLLQIHWRAAGKQKLATIAPFVLGVCVAAVTLIDVAFVIDPEIAATLTRVNYEAYLGLGVSIVSLTMLENIYFNTRPANRWSIKFICVALGGLFVFDFFIYSGAMLTGHIDDQLFQARGALSGVAVPFIMVSAARNPNWSLDVFFSRRFAIRLFALVGSFLYILVLIGLGSLINLVGGAWGMVLKILTLFGGSILLVSILVSGRVRSELVLFLNKHFFTYKFDYREEWLRFLRTVSESDEYPDLAVRVIKGVADIADSPGGVLWTAQPDGGFVPSARWNFQQEIIGIEPDDGSLATFLHQNHWILNLHEIDMGPKDQAPPKIPDWLNAIKGAWLVVPLYHRDELSGFIVLLNPRAPRETNWEDFDLLKTVSTHSASYLAEQEAEKALSEARRFDTFNRQFAFVIHDIKNLVGQLSLLTDNAEKHGDDPEFRRDMIATIHSSVSRLNLLLRRLHGEGERQYPPALLSLPRLVQRTIDQMQGHTVDVVFTRRCGEVWVTAYRDRLSSVFRHLIQNAIDVLPDGGKVEVVVRLANGAAVVDVKDNGPGMSQEFIQNELFQPFKTTKPHGYGIGAYEAKEIVRELGGQIDIQSTLGKGTCISVRLPIVSAASNVGDASTKGEETR